MGIGHGYGGDMDMVMNFDCGYGCDPGIGSVRGYGLWILVRTK